MYPSYQAVNLLSKLQNWRLKGRYIGANTNLTAMFCSVTSRLGVTFPVKNYTYVFCFYCKIVIALPSEFIFYTANVYSPLNMYYNKI